MGQKRRLDEGDPREVLGEPLFGEDLLDHRNVAAGAREPRGDLAVEVGALERREDAQHGVVDDDGNIGGDRRDRRGDLLPRRRDVLGRGGGGIDFRQLGRDLPVRRAGLFRGSGQSFVALDPVPQFVRELEPRAGRGRFPGGPDRGDGGAEVEARALEVARQGRLAPERERVGGADGRFVGRGRGRRRQSGGLLRGRGAAGARRERCEDGKPPRQYTRRQTHQKMVNRRGPQLQSLSGTVS